MQYAAAILKAIQVFEQTELESELEAVLSYQACGGNAALAKALYYFIPMAYARVLLPEVNFPTHYQKELPQGVEAKALAENSLYQELEQIVNAKFQQGLSEAQILAVLKHSPEFKAVNEALHAGKLWSGIQLQLLKIS